jgi:hypothetical protein
MPDRFFPAPDVPGAILEYPHHSARAADACRRMLFVRRLDVLRRFCNIRAVHPPVSDICRCLTHSTYGIQLTHLAAHLT